MKKIIKILSDVLEPFAKMILKVGVFFFPSSWVYLIYYVLIGLDKIFDKLNADINNKARQQIRKGTVKLVKSVNKDIMLGMRKKYDAELKVKMKDDLSKYLKQSMAELEKLIEEKDEIQPG